MWLVGAALWFGKLWTTNNKVKAQGLLHLLQHVEQVGCQMGLNISLSMVTLGLLLILQTGSVGLER